MVLYSNQKIKFCSGTRNYVLIHPTPLRLPAPLGDMFQADSPAIWCPSCKDGSHGLKGAQDTPPQPQGKGYPVYPETGVGFVIAMAAQGSRLRVKFSPACNGRSEQLSSLLKGDPSSLPVCSPTVPGSPALPVPR